MASISVSEILGSDNVSGSRITVNQNFKKVVNAINTIETYLDTSFTPGGSLNVGSILVKKYTRAVTDQIFTCEATGLFTGNLNVGESIGVTKNFTVGLGIVGHGSFTLDGTSSVSSTFSSYIPMIIDSSVSQLQYYLGASNNSPVINPQTLSPANDIAREISASSTFKKVSVIRLDWSTYTGAGSTNCNTIILPPTSSPNVSNGQVITLLVDSPAPASTSVNFKLSDTNLDSSYTGSNIYFNLIAGDADDVSIRRSAITLFADANGWRILYTSGLVSIT